MLLPNFNYHSPETIDDLVSLLSTHTHTAILAGGTDLIVNMKKKQIAPDHILSIRKIDMLTQISEEQDHVRIGAGVTVTDILDSEIIPFSMRTLVQSAKNLGTPLIRNRATIGGNIMSARPAADLICALLALEAEIQCISSAGQRTIPLCEFFKGPGQTTAQSDELLTAILIKYPPPTTGSDYQSIGVREAQDCNLINVACVLSLDTNKYVIKARVALGCVGPTHVLAPSVAKCLEGQKMTASLLGQAATQVMDVCAPIDDFRATAAYRKKMASVLTRRALENAYQQALDS